MNSSKLVEFKFVTNSSTLSAAKLTVDFLFATTAAAANLVLLLTIHKDPHRCLRSPSTNFVVNMAVADFIAGFVSGCLLIAYDALIFINKPNYMDRASVFLIMFIYIAAVSVTVGCCNVVAMACDRWFAVSKALNYRNIVTAKRVNTLIVVFWIYGGLFTSLTTIGVPLNIYELIICHLHVSLPLVVLPVLYWKTFRALGAHTQRVKSLQSGNERVRLKTAQREKKTTKVFVIVLCLFYVAFLPYVIAINLRNLCSVCANSKGFYVFLQISFRFVLLNSSLNPFVYAWRIPKYRRAVRTVINGYCCRRRRNNAINPAEMTGANQNENLGTEETTNTIQPSLQ